MTDKQCNKCKFFVEFDEIEALGICYRYPPVYIKGKPMYEESWDRPTVSDLSYCGEFKRKKLGASIPVAIETSP